MFGIYSSFPTWDTSQPAESTDQGTEMVDEYRVVFLRQCVKRDYNERYECFKPTRSNIKITPNTAPGDSYIVGISVEADWLIR